MRRVAKLTLLLAPLALAGSSGCATQARWMTKDVNVSPVTADRAKCMLYVAEQMESSGKYDLAERIYEHLLSQEPAHPIARQRLDALAERSRRSAADLASALPSDSEKNTTPAGQPAADRQWSDSDLFQDSIAAEQNEIRSAADKLPLIRPASRQAWSGRDDWAQAPVEAEPQSIVAAPASETIGDLPTPGASTPHVDWWSTLFEPAMNPAADTDAASVAAEDAITIVEQAVAQVESADPADAATASEWSPTSMLRLCDDLPERLVPLVQALESVSPSERCDALFSLGQLGAQAQPASLAVRALLDDPDARVRSHAAGALRNIHGDAWDAVHVLAGLLKNGDAETVRFTAYLLGQMGPEAMDAVLPLESLRDSSSGLTRLHAAEALVRIAPDDSGSLKVLTEGLALEDSQLRWFSALSLGSVSNSQKPAAVAALKNALHDPDANVRVTAALSLGGLGTSARSAMNDLEHVAKFDAPEVRQAAVAALACLHDAK